MHLVLLLFALFASLFSLSKSALSVSEPFFLIGSRMTFAGVMLLAYQQFFTSEKIKIKAEHFKHFLMLAVFNIYITNIAEIWGIKHMVSSKACLIYSLSPFLSALLAYFVLRETLNPRKWMGMAIGFIGLWPILTQKTAAEITSGNFGMFSMAELSLLIAVLTSVYGWILLKKLVQEFNYSFITANGFSMALGGFISLIHSYTSGEAWNPVPVSNFIPFLQITLTMCIISNIICYNLYGYLLRRFSATFMSFAGLVTPLFASLFGWLFLGETISYHFFISMALFCFGLTVFYQEELKTEKLIMDKA